MSFAKTLTFHIDKIEGMKVGLISDVHANFPALKQVLEELSDVDFVFCAGDVIGYNPFPSKVISEFREREIDCVLGNHDRAYLEENTEWFNSLAARAIDWNIQNTSNSARKYIERLPESLEREVCGKKFYITHGSLRSVKEYIYPSTHSIKLRGMLEETGCDVLVLGHTHVPMIKELDKGFVVNPGSVGQPRDGDKRASYLLMDLDEMSFEVKRASYEIDRVVEEIKKTKLPNRLGERLFYGK
ncbi:metallophosphoesterase [archaeon SCG-AAA382B04]|nr:metallophosphoesterase [archaeon SCG-AAA382B04]